MDINKILLRTLQKENEIINRNYIKKEQENIEILKKYNELQQKYKEEKNINKNIIEEMNNLKEILDSIFNSRSYKIIQKVKKILGR